MPRKTRMYLPGVPCHVIQRGNNREACFYSDQDYHFYLECIHDACQRYGTQIHAYVLMTNHVHLLITPDRKDSISRIMQSLGRRYVQYINKQYRRTGTLWESRHKASLVDEDQYLFTCMRYIEMNPVRAKMVDHPSNYRWSSFRCNAEAEDNPLVDHHDVYLAIGPNKTARAEAYHALVLTLLDPTELRTLRQSINSSMPTGDEHFKKQIESVIKRKIGYLQQGRPAKH